MVIDVASRSGAPDDDRNESDDGCWVRTHTHRRFALCEASIRTTLRERKSGGQAKAEQKGNKEYGRSGSKKKKKNGTIKEEAER